MTNTFRRWVIGGLLAFLVGVVALTGINCSSQMVESHAVHQAGRVAILPMVDRIGVDLPWDISQELTEGIREKVLSTEQMNVIQNPDEVNDILNNLDAFSSYDHVVCLELINYEEVSKGKISELNMDVKVRVIDVAAGKVVREEMIHSSHLLPHGNGLIDYSDVNYGSSDYLNTPKSVAHHRLLRDVVERVGKILA